MMAPRDDDLARLAGRLADDAGVPVGIKTLAVTALHRLRHGGWISARVWLLRVAVSDGRLPEGGCHDARP